MCRTHTEFKVFQVRWDKTKPHRDTDSWILKSLNNVLATDSICEDLVPSVYLLTLWKLLRTEPMLSQVGMPENPGGFMPFSRPPHSSYQLLLLLPVSSSSEYSFQKSSQTAKSGSVSEWLKGDFSLCILKAKWWSEGCGELWGVWVITEGKAGRGRVLAPWERLAPIPSGGITGPELLRQEGLSQQLPWLAPPKLGPLVLLP